MAESASKPHKRLAPSTTTSRDRLSTLPHSVLLLILSFLPTKQAIATSLLSKTWKSLWLSLSTLNFDDRNFPKNDTAPFRFAQFVDSVLILRHCEPIHKFNLVCGSFCLPSSNIINVWVSAAIKHKVEQLDLWFYFPTCVPLSSNIFVCSTIRVLKLHGLAVVNAVFPVDLPFLKVLHLENVGFPDYNCVAKLLSASEVLEDLVIRFLMITNFCSSGSIVKSLTRLVKAEVPTLYFPLKALYNVESLRLNGSIWTHCHDIPVFHRLTHIEFACFVYSWEWLLKWLQNCPKLQILVFHKISTGLPIAGKGGRLKKTPPKAAPQCLSTQLKQFYLREYQGRNCELQLAKLIMKKARVLKTMSISCISSLNADSKLHMIQKLSSLPRSSRACRLYFN